MLPRLLKDIWTRGHWSQEWSDLFFHPTIQPANIVAPAVSIASPD
jgi:hypothetical protein